jgi:hypothetical protein
MQYKQYKIWVSSYITYVLVYNEISDFFSAATEITEIKMVDWSYEYSCKERENKRLTCNDHR